MAPDREPPNAPEPEHHRLGATITSVVAALLVAGAVFLVVRYGDRVWYYFRNPAELRALVASWGGWAPFGIIAFQVVQIVFAPLPGNVMSFACGYAFGLWPAIVWVMIGVMVGATIDFLLARLVGRRLLRYLVPPDKFAQLDAQVVRWGTFYLFLLLLIPNPVGDFAYYLAGLTALPLPLFLLLVFVGRLPSNLLECGLGSGATRFGWLEWAILAAAVVMVTVLYFRYRDWIARLLERWSHVGRRAG